MFSIVIILVISLTIFSVFRLFLQANKTANINNSNQSVFKPNLTLSESDFSFNFVRRFYPIIFAFLSIFWIFWLNFSAGFPFLGFAIFGISLTIFLLFLIKTNRNSLIFGSISIFLSLSFVAWSPHFLLNFFNFVGLIYALSLLILSVKKSFKYDLFVVLFAPIYLLFYLFGQISPFKNIFPFQKQWFSLQFYKEFYKSKFQNQLQNQKNSDLENILKTDVSKANISTQSKSQFETKNSKNKNLSEILLGIGISLLVILIILPLLASSNQFFANLLTNIFDVITRFFNTIWNFFYAIGFEWILRLVGDFVIAFFNFFSLWNLFLLVIFTFFLPRIFSLIFLSRIENLENLETNLKTNLQENLQENLPENLQNKNSNNLIEQKEPKNMEKKLNSTFSALKQTQQSSSHTLRQNNQLNSNSVTNSNLIWLIPKMATIFVLFVFIISQFFLYFATNLADLNYNYGKLNNEVFGQLSLVCLVIFGLIYFGSEFALWQRICSFILLLQSAFLGFVAFKSVFDYIANFALTFKRLYGVAVVFLVFGFVLIFVVQNITKSSKSFVLQKAILLTFLTLILVNLAGFDSLIYANLPRETDKTDWKYLQELSIDSGNLDKILDKYVSLQREYLKSPSSDKFVGFESPQKAEASYFTTIEECQANFNNCEFNRKLLYDKDSFYLPLNSVIQKVDYLQSKYKNSNTNYQIQSFNLSEFQSFQKIKNVDLEELKKEFYEFKN